MNKLLADEIIPDLKEKTPDFSLVPTTVIADSSIFDRSSLNQSVQKYGKLCILNFGFGLQPEKNLSNWSVYPLLTLPFNIAYTCVAPLSSQRFNGDNSMVIEATGGTNTIRLRTFASEASAQTSIWLRGQIVFFEA